jgi:hypothetical protein
MKPIYFLNLEFTVIYTQKYSYNISRIHSSRSQHEKFNSQIVYSQQYSQHRSKIQYSQHRSSIFTLFPSISIEITIQRPNLSQLHS